MAGRKPRISPAQFLQWCIQHLVILYQIITTTHSICKTVLYMQDWHFKLVNLKPKHFLSFDLHFWLDCQSTTKLCHFHADPLTWCTGRYIYISIIREVWRNTYSIYKCAVQEASYWRHLVPRTWLATCAMTMCGLSCMSQWRFLWWNPSCACPLTVACQTILIHFPWANEEAAFGNTTTIVNWGGHLIMYYPQTSNISCTLVGNNTVDHSDVVGASPLGAAPTTSSFST